ncbi:MAG: 3-hydroxyacyl-CoA dehydrogenase family protein [Rhodospirillaceae bacterium]
MGQGSGSAASEVRKVGVIGAGLMGRGVAQNLSQTGHEVVLVDLNQALLDQAGAAIRQAVRFARMFDKSAPVHDPDEVMGRIELTTGYDSMGDVDFVVENVTEDWQIKKPIYATLDQACPDHAVFAANTSCIPVTKIGAATSRPDKVLGIHFMNPVPMKHTVEMIRGRRTSEGSIAIATALMGAMGKEVVLVNDSPGFVSNRVLMLTVNEAAWTVQDQVADAESVDRIFKQCFGHKMGPLETGDLIGLDTILQSLEVLYDEFADPKFRPCPLLKSMVSAGQLGRKSGEGFYKY